VSLHKRVKKRVWYKFFTIGTPDWKRDKVRKYHEQNQPTIMTTPETIDEKIAQDFVNDPDAVDLSGATSVTDEAAKILAGYEGCINLFSLADISEGAAKALAGHKDVEVDSNKVRHLLGQCLECDVRNYKEIIPKVVEDGVERVLRFDEGGASEYKADFIFDGVTVHISCVENSAGIKTFASVEGEKLESIANIDDEFLRLFAEAAQTALSGGELQDGVSAVIETGYDLGVGLNDEELQCLYQAYPKFYWKHTV